LVDTQQSISGLLLLLLLLMAMVVVVFIAAGIIGRCDGCSDHAQVQKQFQNAEGCLTNADRTDVSP
jgi:hypothetical protein